MKPQHPVCSIQTAAMWVLIVVRFATQEFRGANVLASVDYRGNETDHMALLAIQSRLIDHANNLSSWNHSLHHCSWEGVTCGWKHNRVIKLQLPERGLGGTISPFIGNLSFLRNISLSNNSLSGQVPSEIGRLFRLQSIYLDNNLLNGEIPANISGCINLQTLFLANNNLQGKLPFGLATLSNLKNLYLASNKLFGPIFKVIANLTSLEEIDGYENAFTGTIPHSISKMTNLQWLVLGSNKLSVGTLPPAIFNLSSLKVLDFDSNQLHGSIPQDIASTLPQLEWLDLSDNYFTGSLPISLQNLTTLQALMLHDNNFQGTVSIHFGNLHDLQWLHLANNYFVGDINFIMSGLVNCSKLENLYLSDNNFTGVLPKVVANLSTNLMNLWVGGNPISGGIPIGISNLINLQSLYMSESNLSGTIPQELGKLQSLDNLCLQLNKFTGEIPDSFGNLSRLSRLKLYNNNMHGRIPLTLGRCENLLFIYLYNNKFTGYLPKELFGGFAKLIELDLSHNQIQGSLPMETNQLSKLVYFNVSKNKLSGKVPEGLGSLVDLQYLYINDNFFHGSIPSSFSTLRSLLEVDLSQNNISGSIPEYFSEFSLTYLNLSYNNFEGKVPNEGVFANASAISLVGNNRLCGGIPELHLPRCIEKEKHKKLSRALKMTIIIICAFGGVLAITTCICLYLRCYKRKINKHVSASSIVKEPFLKISYDVLLKATEGFSQRNLLGSGTFGSVYKGILDGTIVAVKVLNLQHRGGSKSFLAECDVLKNTRHRNLVGIITVCSSIDYQRNDFKALVYEFMPNGDLDGWLHEDGNGLSLLQRVDIAMNVAHALNYLHHECEDPIVHCDLKPSNILLDDDFVAHVADFGLAKVLGQPLHPNQSSSIGVRGTVGYAAPEYGLGGEATFEADIYSYGILLLELMTRKRPTAEVFHEDFNLHMYAKVAWPDQVLQIVDSELKNEDDHPVDDDEDVEDTMRMGPRTPERLRRREECIGVMVKIGVACSHQLPQHRMTLSAAINEIQQARNSIVNPRIRRN